MHQCPDEASRTTGNSCRYVAECEVDGHIHRASSRRGAAFELARVLIATGIADQAVKVTHAGLAGCMRYASLHWMATRTMVESATQPVRVGRWQEWVNFPRGEAQNRGEAPADASDSLSAAMPRKMSAPPYRADALIATTAGSDGSRTMARTMVQTKSD